MLMTEFLWMLSKLLIFSILLVLVYVGYAYIYKPFSIRKFYSQYSNVVMSEKYTPFLGEYAQIRDATKKNKYSMLYITEYKTSHPECDLGLVFSKNVPYFYAYSPKAVEEFLGKKIMLVSYNFFVALVPDKIDRSNRDSKGIGQICPGSFTQLRSNKDWQTRRHAFFRLMGINFMSRFIPMIISKFDERSETWKLDKFMNFYKEASGITFNIIVTILFGEKIHTKFGTLTFKSKWNQPGEELNLQTFFSKISTMAITARFKLKNILLPFLMTKHWLYPNNVLKANVETLNNKLQSYFIENDISDSIYSQMLKEYPELDPKLLLADVIALFFAGHDTTSHALCSILFNLKKNPEICEKLIQEMLKSKEPGVTDWKDLITNKFIQETNYLHYVVKEALRIDNPIPCTIEYFCVDDVKLCGVPIPKGTKVYIGISGLHNDITQYKEPDRFIPERFDPESKYFFINSNTESESCEDVKGKPRNIHSFITFGSGPRSCPGMSMANFELKVLTAYFICKFKYEVDQDQLSNEAIKFALFSQFDLKIKITEIVNL